MSAKQEMITLFVCEDDRWSLAEQYDREQAQKATADAKLSLRAGGVSAVRVLLHDRQPQTRQVRKSLLFEAEKPGATPPPPPSLACPSEGGAALSPAAPTMPAVAARPKARTATAAIAAGRSAPAWPAAPDAARPRVPSFFARLRALFSSSDATPRPAEVPAAMARPSETREASLTPRPAPTPVSGRTEAPAPETKRLLLFLQTCLEQAAAMKHVSPEGLDAGLRFAFHLLMLGAAEACRAIQPGKLSLADLLEAPLALLGSERAKARSFVESIDGYRGDTRHAAMIRFGTEAMSIFLQGNGPIGPLLGQALALWNGDEDRPARGEAADRDVAIMFTDMVASVETTQQLGDEGMMALVERHNLIVGTVLKTHRGHQVKHTGDGVMAVFPRVGDGVAAAAEIQRQIAEHNRATAGVPLLVRIGLAAGNPIRREDDYFGTVVQTAARVCPIAEAGEVALTEAMAALPECSGFAYTPAVPITLKGFSRPQPVCKLLRPSDS